MSQTASRGWPEPALQRPDEHICLHLDHLILLILIDLKEKIYLFGLGPVFPFQTFPRFFFSREGSKTPMGISWSLYLA